jgi:outer membrane protein TolC
VKRFLALLIFSASTSLLYADPVADSSPSTSLDSKTIANPDPMAAIAEEELNAPPPTTPPIVSPSVAAPTPAPMDTPAPVTEAEGPAAPLVNQEVSTMVSSTTPVVATSSSSLWSPLVDVQISTSLPPPGLPEGAVWIDKVSIDDAGNRLLVLIQMSKPVESFVFERRDPPSLFVQFIGTAVYASGGPIQVVGTDPLSEIRYGYSNFQDAAAANRTLGQKFPLEYLELKLNRPVFYHVQQEGWVTVVGLDRATTKVDVPELDFRFDKARYEGAANLPMNPRMEDFVAIAQANSKLLSVSRDEAELAKSRVSEARRGLFPALTAMASETKGKEGNAFGNEGVFEGFEANSYKRQEYGLQATQPLFQSGRLVGAYRQSKLNRLMALENVRKQAQDLTYEMKKAHISLLKFQSVLRIRRELVAQGEVLKNMVRKKNELELTSRAEVLNVTAQADQASYQLTGDEQDVALARLVVISVLNQSNPVPDPIPGALSFARLSFNVESIINWAQQHRPDVRIAVLNVELARHNMRAARADNQLKVDASGFLGRAGAAFEDEDFSMETAWNVGLRVSQPFAGNTARVSVSKEHTAPDLGQTFVTDSTQKAIEVGILDALPNVSNSRQSQLQFQRAQAELVEASRKAEYEVRQTYYNLEKAARQLEAVRQDLKYRQKDLEITREKVQLGLAELSQLITAEVSYAQAQITEQDALAAYNIALADMDRVAGAEVVRG